MSSNRPTPKADSSVVLLQGGRELFPAMVATIDAAQQSVWLETYIFEFIDQPLMVAEALARAGERGLDVRVLVDGVGTPTIPAVWRQRWDAAGVKYRIFSPLGRMGLLLPSRWRRLHRKLCVVDRIWAFCGGVNCLDDWRELGGEMLEAPRLDYAVQIRGEPVRAMAQTMARLWTREVASERMRHADLSAAWSAFRDNEASWPVVPVLHWPSAVTWDGVDVAFVQRDNVSHRAHIERAYLQALGQAKHSVVMAHAYFVPGRRLRRALKLAVARGVSVKVLLQGRFENFMQFHAARPVHHGLMRAGVQLFEYTASAVHAKVAVVDGEWATIGSSNLDPLSLLLAREANVVVRDKRVAQTLADQLAAAIAEQSVRADATALAQRNWRQRCLDWTAFALMRAALFVTGKRY
jgi:cardiolipin synthase A/B